MEQSYMKPLVYNTEIQTPRCNSQVNMNKCKHKEAINGKKCESCVKKKGKSKIPCTLTSTAVMEIRFPAVNLSMEKLANLNKAEKMYKKKNKKKMGVDKSKQIKPFMGTRNTGLSHNNHPSTSYSLNAYEHRKVENFQIPDSYRTLSGKNNKKRNKNHFFTPGSISSNNFVEKKKNPAERKRKFSDTSNDFYVNKELRYNHSPKSLHNCASDNFESEKKDDSEIFFFDISGNRRYSHFRQQLNEVLIDKISRNISQDLTETNQGTELNCNVEASSIKKNGHVEAIVDLRDSECEVTSTSDSSLSKKKKKKLRIKELSLLKENKRNDQIENTPKDNVDAQKSKEEIGFDTVNSSNIPEKLKKKNKHTRNTNIGDNECDSKNLHVRKELNQLKNKIDVDIDEVLIEDTSFDLNGSFAAPKKLNKKNKHIDTVEDIRDSECEVDNLSDSMLHKKKKKKRRHFENELNQTKLDRIDPDSTTKEKENSKKKMIADEQFIKETHKKKKRKMFNSDVECSTTNENSLEIRIEEAKAEDIASSFKKSKNSKKYNYVETLIDIRDNDCEMSFSDASFHRKKKKKKFPIELAIEGEENRSQNTKREIFNNDSIKNLETIQRGKLELETSNEELSIDTSGFKSPKKSKKKHKDIEPVVKISDWGISVNDASFHNNIVLSQEESSPTKKNREIFDSVEPSSKNEETPEKSSYIVSDGFMSSKKSKKKCKTLVDIRDSDCEMSINNISSPKKKKLSIEDVKEKNASKKKNKDVEQNENNLTNGDKVENNPGMDISSISKESKKLKKKREDIETLVDIRGSDCEISVINDPVGKKKKKKKIPKENEVPDEKTSMPKKKIGEILNHDIEHRTKHKKTPDYNRIVVEEVTEEPISSDKTSSFKSPKKLKKKHCDVEALTDDRGCDYELSLSNVSIHEEKKSSDTDISLKVKKRSKKKYEDLDKDAEALVDIRDSDYEMSFNKASVSKKKKKDKHLRDTFANEINVDQSETTYKKKRNKNTSDELGIRRQRTSRENGSIILCDNLEKTEKGHEHGETLVDISDGEYVTMSFGDSGQRFDSESIPHDKSEALTVDVNLSSGDDFPENSLDYKCEIDSIDIKYNELTSIEYNRELSDSHNQIDTSSSEGYKSDSSEIMIPVKKFKNVMDNRGSLLERAVIKSCSDKYDSGDVGEINPQISINEEQVNRTHNSEDIFHSEDFVESSEPHIDEDDCEKIKPGYKLRVIVEHLNGIDKKQKKVKPALLEGSEDETIDYISSEDTEEIDIVPKIKQWQTMKSNFVKQYESSNHSKKKTSKEKSDVLEIIKMMKKEVDEEDIETVQQLVINLPFPVPPLHSILTRATIPTKPQLEEIKRRNLEVKHGPFSKEEDQMIINNWKRFYKEYFLTVNPSLFVSFPSKMRLTQRINFVRYLAHGLDNRMLHRVHTRFKILLETPRLKTGRFSPEEDEKIIDFMRHSFISCPFRELSKIMQRPSLSLCKRYKRLTTVKNHSKINWTPEMVDRLVRCMKDITKCDKVKELEDRTLTDKEWKLLSAQMDNIPVLKLQRGWKVTIYPRLFAKKKVDLKTMKEDIIHTLYQRKETDWRTVDWKEIAKDYRGFTPQKIYTTFKHLVHFHVPESKRKDLGESLDYLENIMLKQSKMSTPHKFKKFGFREGRIVIKPE